MKKNFIFVFVLILFLPLKVFTEIKDKEALLVMFENCVKEADGLSVGMQFEYCACITSNISKEMDLKEVVLLGLDTLSAKNEEEQTAILLSNQKVKKFVADCILKVME